MANTFKTVSKTEDELRIANYIVLFGGKDLQGETFTPETDLESSYTKTGTLYVDWEHGFDELDKDEILGVVDWKTARKDEKGWFVERVLNRRNKYVTWLEELIEADLMGNSSEATEKAERVNGIIKRWPLKRDTLTVIPAEPRMLTENQLSVIKSLSDRIPNLKSLLPEDAQESVGEGEGEVKVDNVKVKILNKEISMTDEIKNEVVEEPEIVVSIPDEFDTLSKSVAGQAKKVDELSAAVHEILDRMKSIPKYKEGGYYSDLGGSADETAKSFGDFLLAVSRKDTTRLDKVYKTSMTEGTGAAGGYLVPPEFHNQIMEAAALGTIVRPRATVIPVGTDRGFIPSLDQQTAPTAGVGNTAFAGGVTGGWVGEESAGSETNPGFKQIEYNIKKISAYTPVTNELLADSAMSIDSLLSRLFGTAVGALEEMSFLRGDGVNQPLGMLNAGCAIGITPDTNNIFGFADAVEMISRFKSVGGQPIWIGHISLLPDLGAYFPRGSTGVHGLRGGMDAFIQPRDAIPGSLLGYPLYWSEHMPQANGDAIMLVDPSAYVIFDREPIRVAYSEHANFTSDEGVFRVTKRLDGQPWMSGAITLADPTGSFTVSPIVYHND